MGANANRSLGPLWKSAKFLEMVSIERHTFQKGFNMQEYDENLVGHYRHKVEGVANQATKKDVKADIEKVVKEASDHFAIWTIGNHLGNMGHFRGQIGMTLDITGASQSQKRDALEYAKEKTSEIINGLERDTA